VNAPEKRERKNRAFKHRLRPGLDRTVRNWRQEEQSNQTVEDYCRQSVGNCHPRRVLTLVSGTYAARQLIRDTQCDCDLGLASARVALAWH
jgi:hypothetical protein